MEDNDQQRFESETGEEAHYWFTLSSFADLVEEHGIEKMIKDVQYIVLNKGRAKEKEA